MSRFQRANRAEETATRSIDCAHFSIQTEWRTNASGFELTATWKMLKFVQSLPWNMYPLLNQAAHASRKIQYAVLHRQHPYTRTRTERYKGEGKVQISKCEQRDEAGNVEEEIHPQASKTDRRPHAQSAPPRTKTHNHVTIVSCLQGRRGGHPATTSEVCCPPPSSSVVSPVSLFQK